MQSAERLLGSSSDGQISTREIVAGAGVTAPTLYHHFKDKEALLDAVALDGFTAYLAEKRAVMRSSSALVEFVQGWDMHVGFGCQHPAYYRMMFGNPDAKREPPAAGVARDELARTVDLWNSRGSLAVSADAATATMSAAAVGVTLQLIAMDADSSHPLSARVRDTVAGAIFGERPADTRLSTGVDRLARRLLDELPHEGHPPLRPTEIALLREWLSVLVDSPAN